jgi:hypothetical protein
MRIDMRIIAAGIRDITDHTKDDAVKVWGFEIIPEDVEGVLGDSDVASTPEL